MIDLSRILDKAESFSRSSIYIKDSTGRIIQANFPEVISEVRKVEAYLRSIGITSNSTIALQLDNCYEWVLIDLAMIAIGGMIVGLPIDYKEEENSGALRELVVDLLVYDQSGLNNLSAQFKRQCSVLTLAEFRKKRSVIINTTKNQFERQDDDLYTKVFSSGTTGRLKGLDISRSGLEFLMSEFIEAYGVTERDSQIIFLPLSRNQQRMCVYISLLMGVSLYIVPYLTLLHNIKSLKPSFMIAPPSIYEQIQKVGFQNPAMDWLREVRFMITGMAPIARHTLNAFWESDIPLYEAYGTTETGMISWNTPKQKRIATLGKPLVSVRIRFSGDNEIIVLKEKPLSIGYFWAPEQEHKCVFSPDGTINTGDIGQIDNDGFLLLNGRKKDVIVMGNGTKYHPSQIEEKLKECEAIIDAAVFIDEASKKLSAVIVIEKHVNETRKLVDSWISRCNAVVESYQRIKKYCMSETRFSVSNGMMTANMKINRQSVYRHFSSSLSHFK